MQPTLRDRDCSLKRPPKQTIQFEDKKAYQVWWKMIPVVILGLAAIVTVALTYGSRRWESATQEMHAEMEAARLPVGRKTFNPDELIGLPASVQKYLRAALRDGQPIVSGVYVELSGTINMSATGEKWNLRMAGRRASAPIRPLEQELE